MAFRRRVHSPRPFRILFYIIVLYLAILLAGTAIGTGELLVIGQGSRHLNAASLEEESGGLHADLQIAALAFGAARVCWTPLNPVADVVAQARPLAFVRSIAPLLSTATSLTSAGTRAVEAVAPILAAVGPGHAGGETSVRLLHGLEVAQSPLREAETGVRRTEKMWAHVEAAQLPAGLGPRGAAVGRLLARVDDLLQAAIAAPELLGGRGPKLYLLVPENPWDLRATGGFIGTAALLRIDHGHLTLSSTSSDRVDLGRTTYIPPPLPLLTYEHFSNWYYRDANWEPDFPTSAALLRYFYWLGQREHISRPPDGVIAFDSSLLSPLLGITGPVQFHLNGRSITLDQAGGVQTLDHYVNSTGKVNKGITAAAYGMVFRRLTHVPASRVATAARVLGTALDQAHLLLWFPGSPLASILARHQWDGAIQRTAGDYIFPVDTNVQYNKINNLVRESLSYDVHLERDRSLLSTLTIVYTNTATLAALPPPQNNTLYEDFLRVYVPLGSLLIKSRGFTEEWHPTRWKNKTVFAGVLHVPSLGTTRVTLRYRVPPNTLMNADTYTLFLQKQPGTSGLPLHIALQASPGVLVGGGSGWGWSGNLTRSLRLSTRVSGGRARPIPLVYDTGSTLVAPGAVLDPWTVLPDGLRPLP